MQTTVRMVMILLGTGGFFANLGAEPATEPQLFSLPDNPCDVLSVAELAHLTGLEVTSARRVPGIGKIVRAQREGREPGPGTICSYETRSDFGAILIKLPTRSDRRSDLYWQARSKYFETFPDSAQHIEGLGMDAWLAGGTTLRVLVSQNEYLTLQTQMHQRQSRELLVDLARVILRRQ